MGVLFQAVELATPADGTEVQVQTDPDSGVVQSIDPRVLVTKIQVAQTTSAGTYEAFDAIGGLITFSNAARIAGGSIHVEGVQIVDEDAQLAAMDLVLFSVAPGTVTDEVAFDPTDAELLDCVGVIPISVGSYHLFNDNAVAHVDCTVTCKLTTTTLYGVLVSRGTPTYASTSSIHVTVEILQD
jgi:hypothetical protein